MVVWEDELAEPEFWEVVIARMIPRVERRGTRLPSWVNPETGATGGGGETTDVVVSFHSGNVRRVLGGEGLGFMHQKIAGQACFVKVAFAMWRSTSVVKREPTRICSISGMLRCRILFLMATPRSGTRSLSQVKVNHLKPGQVDQCCTKSERCDGAGASGPESNSCVGLAAHGCHTAQSCGFSRWSCCAFCFVDFESATKIAYGS